VTGLVEGAGLLAFQHYGVLAGFRATRGVALEIVWISAAFDVVLFSAVGLVIIGAGQMFRRLATTRIAVVVFAFLTFFDWAALSNRISNRSAVILAAGLTTVVIRRVSKQEAQAPSFWQRALPWAAAVVVAAFGTIQGGLWIAERASVGRLPQPKADAPNVLVIVVDALRADHVSAHGYYRPTTPNIDRLANEGVLFENAIAPSSWTLPTHASLLTGRYPHEHGALYESYDGRYPTLAQALRSRGYRTAGFSGNTFFFTRAQGLGRGFIHFDDFFHTPTDMVLRTFYGRRFCRFVFRRQWLQDYPARKLSPEVTANALRWIERDPEKPFFIFLNYYDAHDPYVPPQPFRSRFSRFANPGGRLNHLASNGWGEIYRSLGPEEVEKEIDAYDGAIAFADESIGRLIWELEKRGLAANTLVVVTSDHGEAFGEHGFMAHRYNIYREMIHVPLILWAPGRIPAGLRLQQPVSNAAVAATVAELIGDDGAFPGTSLAKIWSQPKPPEEWPYVLAELEHEGTYKSLVTSRWQFILNQKQELELYDWQNDPRQANNLANSPEGRSMAAELEEQLASILSGESADRTAAASPETPREHPAGSRR
jgi:arylsulfatase A-like enzyme